MENVAPARAKVKVTSIPSILVHMIQRICIPNKWMNTVTHGLFDF